VVKPHIDCSLREKGSKMIEKEGEEPFRENIGRRKYGALTINRQPSTLNSTSIEAPNGDILLFYRAGSHHLANDNKIYMVRFDWIEQDWEPPRVVAEDPNYACLNVVSGIVPNEERIVVLYGKYDPDTKTMIGRFMKYSDDSGETWSSEAHKPLSATSQDYQNSVGNLVAHPENGKLGYMAIDGENTLVFYYTYDGITWHEQSTFDWSSYKGEPREPDLFQPPRKVATQYQTKGNYLFVGIRSIDSSVDPADERFWILRSTDFGETWETPFLCPNVRGNQFRLIPFGYRIGVISRAYYTSNTQLYVSETGLGGFIPQRFSLIYGKKRKRYAAYVSWEQLPSGDILLMYPIEQEEGNRQGKTGVFYTILDPAEFTRQPIRQPFFDSSGNMLRGQSLDSGDITSQHVSVAGFDKYTLYFRSDTAGTLTIEVKTIGGTWRTYDTISISSGELESYILTGAAHVLRVNWNPDSYPSTIQEVEIHLR